MGDFSTRQPAPQSGDQESRAPHDQGGEPVTGFIEAPRNDEDQNFAAGPGVPPGGTKIH